MGDKNACIYTMPIAGFDHRMETRRSVLQTSSVAYTFKADAIIQENEYLNHRKRRVVVMGRVQSSLQGGCI